MLRPSFAAMTLGVPRENEQTESSEDEPRDRLLDPAAGFEAFFRDLAEADRNGQIGVEDPRRIAARYGLTFMV
jgi:hypothetical protein